MDEQLEIEILPRCLLDSYAAMHNIIANRIQESNFLLDEVRTRFASLVSARSFGRFSVRDRRRVGRYFNVER
jgi:hypothetical protein